jgi:hypothetical protein
VETYPDPFMTWPGIVFALGIPPLLIAGSLLAVYRYSTNSYELSRNALILRMRLLGLVPFPLFTACLKFSNIQEVRLASPEEVPSIWILPWTRSELRANRGASAWLVVTLRGLCRMGPTFSLKKRFYITPDNPQEFLEELRRRIMFS